MKTSLSQFLGLAGLLVSPCLAIGQSYSIDWYTIDGGGGASSGGAYSLTGTIGQPDAGVLTGGNYSLVGGFWGILAAVSSPGAPELMITRNLISGAVTISWPNAAAGFALQENPDLSNPMGWLNVGTTPVVVGTNKTVTVPSPIGNRFYRLRNPAGP